MLLEYIKNYVRLYWFIDININLEMFKTRKEKTLASLLLHNQFPQNLLAEGNTYYCIGFMTQALLGTSAG